MKIKEIKALARETLLENYHKLILAKLLVSLLSLILMLISGVLLLFTMVNLGFFTDRIKWFIPGFAASTPAAIIGVILLTAMLVFSVIFFVWVDFGYTKLMLHIARGQKASTADILYGFRKEAHPWKVFWTELLCGILVMANLLLPAFVQAIAVVCGYVPEEAESNNPWSIAILVVTILAALWMIYEVFALAFADIIVIDDPEIDVMDAIRKSMKITRGNKLRMFWLVTFSFLFWAIPLEIVPIIGLWVKPYIGMTVTLFYLSISGGLKDNPAYRELFRNEFAEKLENRVVAHAQDRKEALESAKETAAERAEETTEKVEEIRENREETREEIREEIGEEVKAEAAERAENVIEAKEGAAERTEAAREIIGQEAEVPVQHFPMGRVNFAAFDQEMNETAETHDLTKAEGTEE